MIVEEAVWLRFWTKVSFGDGCWEWMGGHQSDGYGCFNAGPNGTMLAHRFAYLEFAAIPDGLMIDHLCRNRNCVNPAHMECVTSRTNTLRGETLAAREAAQTHCIRNHPLSGPNLILTSQGKRNCRICRTANMRAWHVANRRKGGN